MEESYKSEMDTIRSITRHAAKFPLLTADQERVLIAAAQSPDLKVSTPAMSTILDHNLRLVIKKAREFVGRGLPLEDLFQEGCTGLIRAVEKFDLERKVKLSTYATRWIEQRVRRALENKSRLVKVPLNKLAQITALKKQYKKYIEDENRPPSSEEIADILGISKKEAEELGRLGDWAHISLNKTAGDEDNLELLAFVEDETITAHERAENFADKVYVEHLLSFLSKDEADFLRLKYGFLDNRERTNREMGQLLSKTTKEIAEREKNILSRLQNIADLEKVCYEP